MSNEKNTPKRTHDPDDLLAGLIYGILGGLSFAVLAWGIDAFQLANASAGYPWLKFAIGGLTCAFIGGLAGWITAYVDKSLVGMLVWMAAGVGFGYLASHLPFEIITKALHLLDPRLQGIDFSYPENMRMRMIVVYFLIVLCAALAGGLQNVIIESSRRASTGFMRWLTLCIVIPFFALAGLVAADYTSQPFSAPVITVDELLQFHQGLNGRQPTSQEVREKHYRALANILGLADKPYRLFLSSMESEYLDSSTVLIDFQGEWAECTVFVNSLGVCKLGMAYTNPEQGQQSNLQPTVAPLPTSIPTADPTQPAVPTAGGATPAARPMLGDLPDNLGEAPDYHITLDVDYDQHSFTGAETVTYTNTESVALDRLYFRLIPNGHGAYGNGRLDVSQVEVDGQPVQTQLSDQDTVLEVPLAEPLQPGQKIKLDLAFNGQVPVDFGGQAEPYGYGIYNYADNVLALSGWYPILAVYDERGWNLDFPSKIGDSVYSDMATYTVDVSAPKELVVAASGVQTESQEDGEVKRLRYETGPMRDFFLIMSPDFQLDSRQVDGTTVNFYALPNHTPAAQLGLDVAADSLEIYNQRFGAYPYSELDVVDAPMRNASGVEFPGIVLIADKLFDTPENPSFTVATAHEVAHQWWYNVVGNNVFTDPWLDEALTTYTSSLYYEDRQGKGAAAGLIDYWKGRYQGLVEKGLDDQITQSLSHFEGLNNPGVYGGVVYSKGALFFDALRQEIGDKAFFSALKDYYTTYQYQIARPSDLLDAFEKSTGLQLDEFYNQWLYTP